MAAEGLAGCCREALPVGVGGLAGGLRGVAGGGRGRQWWRAAGRFPGGLSGGCGRTGWWLPSDAAGGCRWDCLVVAGKTPPGDCRDVALPEPAPFAETAAHPATAPIARYRSSRAPTQYSWPRPSRPRRATRRGCDQRLGTRRVRPGRRVARPDRAGFARGQDLPLPRLRPRDPAGYATSGRLARGRDRRRRRSPALAPALLGSPRSAPPEPAPLTASENRLRCPARPNRCRCLACRTGPADPLARGGSARRSAELAPMAGSPGTGAANRLAELAAVVGALNGCR